MKLKFLWLGATKNAELDRLEEQYLKRLKKFYRVERIWVPELRKSDPRQMAAQMEREAALLEKKLNPQTFLTALDERGRQFSSVEWADFLRDLIDGGTPEITFLCGGSSGIPRRIKENANQILSLSRMTLTHELARVALLEQVYRAVTIFKGLPYHK